MYICLITIFDIMSYHNNVQKYSLFLVELNKSYRFPTFTMKVFISCLITMVSPHYVIIYMFIWSTGWYKYT